MIANFATLKDWLTYCDLECSITDYCLTQIIRNKFKFISSTNHFNTSRTSIIITLFKILACPLEKSLSREVVALVPKSNGQLIKANRVQEKWERIRENDEVTDSKLDQKVTYYGIYLPVNPNGVVSVSCDDTGLWIQWVTTHPHWWNCNSISAQSESENVKLTIYVLNQL